MVAYVVVSLVHPYRQEGWRRAVSVAWVIFLEGLTFCSPFFNAGISPAVSLGQTLPLLWVGLPDPIV